MNSTKGESHFTIGSDKCLFLTLEKNRDSVYRQTFQGPQNPHLTESLKQWGKNIKLINYKIPQFNSTAHRQFTQPKGFQPSDLSEENIDDLKKHHFTIGTLLFIGNFKR